MFFNLNMTYALIILAFSLSLYLALSLARSNDDMTENPIHSWTKSVIWSG